MVSTGEKELASGRVRNSPRKSGRKRPVVRRLKIDGWPTTGDMPTPYYNMFKPPLSQQPPFGSQLKRHQIGSGSCSRFANLPWIFMISCHRIHSLLVLGESVFGVHQRITGKQFFQVAFAGMIKKNPRTNKLNKAT